jgi:hypothetical protein
MNSPYVSTEIPAAASIRVVGREGHGPVRGHCHCHPHHHQTRKLSESMQDGGNASKPMLAIGTGWRKCGVRVVVVRERGCWQRKDSFRRFIKGPVVTKNECVAREIEIVEGILGLTLSATHLVGLPHQGFPQQFSYPSRSIRKVAHIPL